MTAGLPGVRSVPASSCTVQPSTAEVLPGLSFEVFRGRLAEVSGGAMSAALTLAFRLVREAQAEGEPAAWILGRGSTFFPPDAARAGVDLAALAVVRLPVARGPSDGSRSRTGRDASRGRGSHDLAAAKAADLLVRSGGFGVVVLDLGSRARLPLAPQARLAGLAERHRTLVLCLTESSPEDPSLGSLVSLRLEAARCGPEERSRWQARVLKDKRLGMRWQHEEVSRAPDGLC